MAEYCWMSLNMHENVWINCSGYTKVLNMPRYSYNSIIIIVTNIIMLELSSARFLHPVALLPFNHFFNMSQNIRMLKIFNKLFSLTTMTSELSKYLNKQLDVFLNVKRQKWSWLKTKKWFFKKKLCCIM